MNKSKYNTKKIVLTAIMASIVFICTYLTRIELSILGSHTIIHLGNMACIVISILFGGLCGGIAGGLGMAFFDIVSGTFIAYFPFTFILKFFMGLICGNFKTKYYTKISHNKLTLLSASLGLLFNMIFSPIVTLLIRVWIYKLDFHASIISMAGSIISVIINAILSFIISLILIKFLENKI